MSPTPAGVAWYCSLMLDLDFITERVAVGGAILTRENFEGVLRAGITHIINTQLEFDDRTLRRGSDHVPDSGEADILWLPLDDDLLPKPAEAFFAAVRYVMQALERPEARVLIHCASGIHRAPMVALALLRVQGFTRHEARALLEARRPQVHFPPVYLDSVEAFVAEWEAT
ncbi:MAG: dual specificity protein phosphatase family protein [Candidatus Acidiferrales bacterium]